MKTTDTAVTVIKDKLHMTGDIAIKGYLHLLGKCKSLAVSLPMLVSKSRDLRRKDQQDFFGIVIEGIKYAIEGVFCSRTSCKYILLFPSNNHFAICQVVCV